MIIANFDRGSVQFLMWTCRKGSNTRTGMSFDDLLIELTAINEY